VNSLKIWAGLKYAYIAFEILAASSAIVILLSPVWGHQPYWENDTVVKSILEYYSLIVLPAAMVIYKSIFTGSMLITMADEL
jgi:hypothetical protein